MSALLVVVRAMIVVGVAATLVMVLDARRLRKQMKDNLRYKIQNRHQNEGWQNLDESYEHCGDAIIRASELSANSVMMQVRVLDTETSKVIITYAAGGGIIA